MAIPSVPTLIQTFTLWWQSPLIWGSLGFFLGKAAVFGEIWPCGLAYVAVWRVLGGRRVALAPTLGVLCGLVGMLGLRLALPYCAAVVFLWLMPDGVRRTGRYWLVGSMLLKMGLHFVLTPIPMVFIIAITECVLALFSYQFIYFTVKCYLEEKLAARQLQVVFVLITLILSVNWHWGGFSPRLFLMHFLIVGGARLGGLSVSCILGPALALLALLLGESSQMVLLLVCSSLLVGFLHKYRWGYYLGSVLALIFAASGPADPELIQRFLVLIAAVWVAGRIPDSHLKLLARLAPGTESFKQQNQGYDQHLKLVFDHKIDQYLTVFEELENILADSDNPLFHKQMQGMAELLKTMKTAFTPDVHFITEFEQRLLNNFVQHDLRYITVLKGLDGYEVYGARQKRCPTGLFCQQVADFCTGTIESQHYGVVARGCSNGAVCSFQIAPCPRYKLEIGKAKVASEEISGDSQVTFEITPSKVAIVLSDGMGVGQKAHLESSVAVRLLERMIKAGYELAAAVTLINRLLIMRNQDDMFVTIDLVVVDLFSGQLEFVKIGAAPSFIKRGREVEVVYNHALPVGMLCQVDVTADRRMLKEGELLIMTTDGVLDAPRGIARKEEWMVWNLRRSKPATDMASMAEQILSDSLEVAQGKVHDDMMVVTARLLRVDWQMDVLRRTQSSV